MRTKPHFCVANKASVGTVLLAAADRKRVLKGADLFEPWSGSTALDLPKMRYPKFWWL